MKKIIRNLLEQYEKDMDMPQFAVQYYTDEYIISKHYGFIKWLVDNDKIDTKKVAERRKEDGWSIVNYNHDEEQMTRDVIVEYWVDNTLMALSISDTPIDDLISYLK